MFRTTIACGAVIAVSVSCTLFAAAPPQPPKRVDVSKLPHDGVPKSADAALVQYRKDTQILTDEYAQKLEQRREQLVAELQAIAEMENSRREQLALTKVLKELTGDRTAVGLLPMEFRSWQDPTSTRPSLRAVQHGLALFEYPRHRKQDKDVYYVDPSEFGPPIGDSKIITNLAPMTYEQERNAIAVGYLKIEKAGEYGFVAREGAWDHTMLIVNGELVCPFQDGGYAIGRIVLDKGLVPFAQVGFFLGREVGLRWQPPGALEVEAIPEELYFSPKRL